MTRLLMWPWREDGATVIHYGRITDRIDRKAYDWARDRLVSDRVYDTGRTMNALHREIEQWEAE